MNDTIKQIIPADGWVAICITDDPPHYRLYPLACWALVDTPTGRKDDSTETDVRGMVAGEFLTFADEEDGFQVCWLRADIDAEMESAYREEAEEKARKRSIADDND